MTSARMEHHRLTRCRRQKVVIFVGREKRAYVMRVVRRYWWSRDKQGGRGGDLSNRQ